MLRFITAGESHGPALTTIIEGLPANMPLDIDAINANLARRQQGYGRGNRMKIETDQITVTSGLRHGLTLGSPLTLTLENKDYRNWAKVMDPAPVADKVKQQRTVHHPRPGHADLVGGLKYGFKDLRNVLERSSARETTMRVALGSVMEQLLQHLDIDVIGYVAALGGIHGEVNPADYQPDQLRDIIDQSEVKMIDPDKAQAIKDRIDQAKRDGDTLGGIVEVRAYNVPAGLGSYVQWDRKLDGRLAQAMVSINAFKGVEFGDGFKVADRPGSQVMDEIAYAADRGFYHKSDHLGGIEGGMSNGDTIIVRGVKKPIPTLYKPLDSVNIYSKEVYQANIERSDTTAVPAATIIAQTVVATELAQAVLEKFPHDNFNDLKAAVADYRADLKDPAIWQSADQAGK
ncbi:chorismate synthase [Aerococcus urinaehominis]|uniref:Chorismate synthase n=1 Tax=Aerococcus urinaehominis TaxID=128944 RepID=A0A0X8FML3_9LACT|nr:chorismate synthase [Aerococcus urinaehominis]AMB99859.1 chorismate synthase [Aerococcus urinaehominis]SDM53948.1 chorismate synthase [Aerococcus urinaehominis]